MSEPTTEIPVEVAHLFMSISPSIKYIFKDSTVANFMGHRYFTTVKEHIAELTNEVRLKHPEFYINPNERIVNPAEQDPMSRLRKRIIEEHYAELARTLNPDNDQGHFEQQTLTPGSTTSIAALAAGGDARTIHSRLAHLIPPTA